ncbi:MAG: lysylphosphatidylglycerol synthase transmembrane domain-containing protein, partial [Candidatus Pacebacteria bacterium]|nr:lysylphosphatidylglycerol synthase transmembrane domain-containing protein [Candidatus Paceibacterota bacterium]
RASLLEHKEKIGWDKALASVIIERIIEWTINVLIILLGAFYFFFRIAKPSENILVIFGISFLITITILLLVYMYIFRKKSLLKKFISKISGENFGTKVEKILFEYFDLRKVKLWKGYFLSLIKVFAMLFRVWLIIFFLGNALEFMPSLSILSFSFLSTLIPIPATLGVQELIQSFAFENLNISSSILGAFTMLLRSGDVIVSVTGFVLFFKAGYDFLKGKVFKNEK